MDKNINDKWINIEEAAEYLETSIYEINEMLESCGYEPLGSSSVE